MPIDDFSENRNFVLPSGGANINEEAFKKFVEQHNPDIIKGYFMALEDLLPKIKSIVTNPGDAGKRNAVMKLHEYLKGLMHLNSYLHENKINSDANMPPFNP